MMLFHLFTVRHAENPHHENPRVQYADYHVIAASLSEAWDQIKGWVGVSEASEAWGRPFTSEEGPVVMCPDMAPTLNRQETLHQHAHWSRVQDAYTQIHAGPESLEQHNNRLTSANGLICDRRGTVTDTNTGLMWMRPLLGQWMTDDGCVRGNPKSMSVDDALEAAAESHFAGHHDWRVPTIDELMTLEASAQANFGRLDQQIFGKANRTLWSSSPTDDNGEIAYNLVLSYGLGANYRTECLQVRLVRNVT